MLERGASLVLVGDNPELRELGITAQLGDGTVTEFEDIKAQVEKHNSRTQNRKSPAPRRAFHNVTEEILQNAAGRRSTTEIIAADFGSRRSLRNYSSLTEMKGDDMLSAPQVDRKPSEPQELGAYLTQFDSRNSQKVQKLNTYTIAGKFTERETNAIGNLINGSPSKVEKRSEQAMSENVRFKRLDPTVALDGLHTTPQKTKEYNVKKAVNYAK